MRFLSKFVEEMDEQDSIASGYVADSFEGVSSSFTEIEILRATEINVIARAKRYGRWWLLKGISSESACVVANEQRLRKEFELMVRLQHPNIVATSGLENVEGLGICIVMEWIEGKTLREVIDNDYKPLSRDERRRIFGELADAIEYSHKEGVVHRDIKPQNILITDNAHHVKLIDFGLSDTDSYTILKQPAGTPPYMSPGQSKLAVADVRNDIYSLGVLMSMMDLGSPYDAVARRCQMPSDGGYNSIAELRADLNRRISRRKQLRVYATVIALIGVVLGTVFFISKLAQPKAGEVDVEAIKADIVEGQQSLLDSLADVNRSFRDSISNDAATLSDNIFSKKSTAQPTKEIVTIIKDDNTNAVQHNIEISNAIDEGCALVDRVAKTTDFNHFLDTVTASRYLYSHPFFKRHPKEMRKYLSELPDEFTQQEKEQIRLKIKEYFDKNYYNRWENLTIQLPK